MNQDQENGSVPEDHQRRAYPRWRTGINDRLWMERPKKICKHLNISEEHTTVVFQVSSHLLIFKDFLSNRWKVSGDTPRVGLDVLITTGSSALPLLFPKVWVDLRPGAAEVGLLSQAITSCTFSIPFMPNAPSCSIRTFITWELGRVWAQLDLHFLLVGLTLLSVVEDIETVFLDIEVYQHSQRRFYQVNQIKIRFGGLLPGKNKNIRLDSNNKTRSLPSECPLFF